MNDGMFFKTATGKNGHFHRDLPGRADGHFLSPLEKRAYEEDIDADPISTGFHRPAKEQPEALEAGGDRFHASNVLPTSSGTDGIKHGVNEGGSLSVDSSTNPSMKKTACPRFLGTGFAKEAYSMDDAKSDASNAASSAGDFAKEQGGQLLDSAKEGVSTLGGAAKDAVGSIAKNKWAALVAAGLGARALAHGAGRAVRGTGHAIAGAGRSLVGAGKAVHEAKEVGMLARARRALHNL